LFKSGNTFLWFLLQAAQDAEYVSIISLENGLYCLLKTGDTRFCTRFLWMCPRSWFVGSDGSAAPERSPVERLERNRRSDEAKRTKRSWLKDFWYCLSVSCKYCLCIL